MNMSDQEAGLGIWKAKSFAFSSRYQKLQLNSEIPMFYVSFLGRCEINNQDEVSKSSYRAQLVSEICENLRRQSRRPRKVELSISWHGIEITELRTGSVELIPIFLINRGMTDVDRPRIFAFLSQNAVTKRMECFAFGTNKVKTSWAMTLCLKRSFEVAYETWKTEQKKRSKFHSEKLLSLAEDLLKSRHECSSADQCLKEKREAPGNIEEIGYFPRTTWTKFEEELMEKPRRRFSSKMRSCNRRMPSVREVVGQPAVDSMFRQRQQVLDLHASVFDVGDNEGLHKAVEDEEVQILSLTGMDKDESKKETCDIDEFM